MLSSVPSLGWADEPSLVDWTQRRVESALVKPLAQREGKRSRFSRERQPPSERRVRVTQATTSADKKGRAFVPFAVDARFSGDNWRQNDMVGCVYRGSGDIYLKFGNEHYPAAILLGKDVKPVTDVCEAAPPPSAPSS
ncbi:MAG TPA: hypothetical protein VEQ58_08170 [Polyangiaceae bacterium]|nr:hypothetical protein [Polyangiaceae bacterium]